MRVFLCEKPSQGKDIARVLGAGQRGRLLQRRGCRRDLVHRSSGRSGSARRLRRAIQALGHRATAHLPERWRVEPKAATAAQFKSSSSSSAKAGELVIATDADREGEMIAREIIDLCGYRGPIQRLWLSALNDASIRKALGALKPSAETLPLYYSALARSRADWLIGMNLSRLVHAAGAAGRLHRRAVGGPRADADAEAGGGSRPRDRALRLRAVLGRRGHAVPCRPILHRKLDAARRLHRRRRPLPAAAGRPAGRGAHARAGSAQVVSVETERVREGPPLPFDLGTLQEVCSKQLGLDVQETLDIAQALYETHKATTYPRSDSGYLPESMLAEVPTVLDSLVKTDPGLRPLIGRLDRTQRSRAWNDGKVTAHHGIIPTLEPANLSAMNEKELAVYRLIRAHYLAQFLPHHEFDRTVAQLACGGQSLLAVGKQIAVAGWRQVLAAPEPERCG
jgi:DNA topoisomerase-3